MSVPSLNTFALLPLIIVCLTGLLVLILDVTISNKKSIAWISLIGVLLAGYISLLQQAIPGFDSAFQNVAIADGYTNFLNLIFVSTAALSILVAMGHLDQVDLADKSEYYAILLFATAGMMIMAAATDLMLVFLGLETMSIALYIMVAMRQSDRLASEAAIKYFLMGSFASAFFLYGVAMVYGATGSINFAEIGEALNGSVGRSPMALFGLGMLIVGFGFKVAAAPFQWWTPDVYYGSPIAITTFMSVGAKVAGFAALIRMTIVAFTPTLAYDWQMAIAILAVLTMVIGNVAALAQKNVKSLLAYSGIAHAGYILVGVTAGTDEGAVAALFYMFVYVFMNIGAFTMVCIFERKGTIGSQISDYVGLASRHPMLACSNDYFPSFANGFSSFRWLLGEGICFWRSCRRRLGLACCVRCYHQRYCRLLLFEYCCTNVFTPRPTRAVTG